MPSWSRHLVGLHVAGEQPGAVLALDGVRLLLVGVGAEDAGDRLENVGRRDDAFEMAVFVVDQRHRHLRFLQRGEHVERVGLVVDDRRLAHMLAQVEALAGEQRGEQVARLDHADHGVDRAFADRQARMLAFPSASCGRVASSHSRLSQSTSVRGVITARTARSPSRMTPAIMRRSSDSIVP